MENNMLKVQLDLAKGTYTISRDNGNEVIVKEINDKAYDKITMDKRRKEIEKLEGGQSKWIPSDLLKLVDPVLYDALEEFDNKYGTQYRSGYVKAITKQIPRVGMSEFRSKKRQYQERALKERTDDLRKAGISLMEYNVSIFGKSAGLSLTDKIRVLRIANAQKTVSATVKHKERDFVFSKIKNVGTVFSRGINAIKEKIDEGRAKSTARKLELSQKRLEESIPRDENGLIDDVPELSEEELLAINSTMLEQTGQVFNIENNAKLEPEVRPVDEKSQATDENITAYENIVADETVGTNPLVSDGGVIVPNHSMKGSVEIGAKATAVQAGDKLEHPEIKGESNPVSDGIRVEASVVKKNMSRSKTIQASKQAARDAGKLKNSYQARIKAKADAKIAAAEGRQKAAAKRAEDAQKAEQQEQERIAREREEQIQQQIAAEEARIAAEEAERALNEKKLSTRLSRKLKSVQDSIRNKVHMPDMSEYRRKITGAVTLSVEKAKEIKKEAVIKFTRQLKNAQDSIRNKVHIPKLTGPQRAIAGTVAALVLAGGIGLGVAATQANADASTRIPVEPTVPVVETFESTRPELSEIEQVVYRDNLGHKENMGESTIGETQNNAGTAQEKSAEDIQREYLSSIRVGSNMKIDSGKYFASPDGTGNFGYFENYQDGVKEITIIGITTNEGYKVIKDSNVNLYELKQQYPDAKFSYHFVFRHSDGRTTTLGWLTENSMEQNIQMENMQQADEGR